MKSSEFIQSEADLFHFSLNQDFLFGYRAEKATVCPKLFQISFLLRTASIAPLLSPRQPNHPKGNMETETYF